MNRHLTVQPGDKLYRSKAADMLYQNRRRIIDQIIHSAESCSTPDIREKALFLKKQNFPKGADANSEQVIPWPLVLSQSQLDFVETLSDIIIPEDQLGPKASAIHVHDFIHEWFSVPSAHQKDELRKLLEAIAKFDELSRELFTKDFASLAPNEKPKILDEIIARRRTDLKSTFAFFVYFRKVAGVAYYMTTEGEAAIGYTHANKSDSVYIGPPPEILKKLGFENGDT